MVFYTDYDNYAASTLILDYFKQHKYSYATDKSTRSGPIKNTTTSDSYAVTSTTQRFMPYELVLVKK